MIPVVDAYSVHLQVNSAMRFRRDVGKAAGWRSYYSQDPNDNWRDDTPEFGDCDDFAMSKRRRLLEMGYSAADIRPIMVARNRSAFVNHMVLAVRTERGWYAFDVESFYQYESAPNHVMLVEGQWRFPRTRDGEPSMRSAAYTPSAWADLCKQKDARNEYDHDCYAVKPVGDIRIEFISR